MVYAADGGELAIRFPDDWKSSRTPGINRLRWSVDAAGTITLEQIDDDRLEPWFLPPFVRIGGASPS